MSSRIPPLLEPYLALPSEASLILLTSVLGASANWLVLRFLHSALIGSDILPSDAGAEDEPKVLLVSFMRDAAFWRENAKRLVSRNLKPGEVEYIFVTRYLQDNYADVGSQGLDLDKFAAKKRFMFIDGLSGLFTPKHGKPMSSSKGGDKILVNSGLGRVSEEIHAAIEAMKTSPGGSKVLLVVDQLDLLLAAGGEDINAMNIGEMLVGFRDVSLSILLLFIASINPSSGSPFRCCHGLSRLPVDIFPSNSTRA